MERRPRKPFFCNWCGKEWHKEDKCYRKMEGKLPTVERRREQHTWELLCNFKKYKNKTLLKTYFKEWNKMRPLPPFNPVTITGAWADVMDDDYY